MKHKLRNFIWTITGIILMGVLVFATTIIKDTGISTINLSATGNITSDWLLGKLNWSNVQNAPTSNWLTTYNSTYHLWAYNQSDGSFNSTYNTHTGNLTMHNTTYWYNQTGIYSYNQSTATYNMYNTPWTATYNSTYHLWAYNQTTASTGTYNSTYATWLPNYTAFNQFWYNMTPTTFYNSTYNIWAYNMTTASTGTYNSTYATWLPNYTASRQFWYNMTPTIFYNSTYQTWSYNMTTPFTNWLSTFAYNYNQTTPAISYANTNFYNKSANINTGAYNITTTGKICFSSDCSKYMWYNGTALIIQG